MKKICVFCGSALEVKPIFQETAWKVGEYLAKNGFELIYGGGDRGLMGAVANGALEKGGKVTGIITGDIKRRIGHGNKAKLIVVKNYDKRKELMLKMADASIALPGGFGTLDETFAILTSASLGYHEKPFGFLNVNGYYDLLLAFLDLASKENFVLPQHRTLAISTNTISRLIKKLSKSAPKTIDKL